MNDQEIIQTELEDIGGGKRVLLSAIYNGEKSYRLWFQGCGQTLEDKLEMLKRDIEWLKNGQPTIKR